MLVELDEAVAETLVNQEELVLSAADEASVVMTSNVGIDLISLQYRVHFTLAKTRSDILCL